MAISKHVRYQRKVPKLYTYVRRDTREKLNELVWSKGLTRTGVIRSLIHSYLEEHGYEVEGKSD